MNWYNLSKFADRWPIGIEDTIIEDGVKIVRETFKEVAGGVEKGVNQARTSMKEGPVHCENCGQDNAKFAKFCSKCGKEL